MAHDKTLQEEGLKMASMRAEAKDAAMYTYESPMTKRINERVDDHQMKLQEHRQKLDQHKMYLMHIAAEADLVEQMEDSSHVPTINNHSRDMQSERTDNVETLLQNKGLLYESNRQNNLSKKLEAEDKACTFTPMITNLARNSGANEKKVELRLLDFQKHYDENKEKHRQRIETSSDNRLIKADESRVASVLGKIATIKPQPHQPVITERSQRKHRNYHDCLSWGEEQKSKKEEVREKFEELQLAEVRPAPLSRIALVSLLRRPLAMARSRTN